MWRSQKVKEHHPLMHTSFVARTKFERFKLMCRFRRAAFRRRISEYRYENYTSSRDFHRNFVDHNMFLRTRSKNTILFARAKYKSFAKHTTKQCSIRKLYTQEVDDMCKGTKSKTFIFIFSTSSELFAIKLRLMSTYVLDVCKKF